MNEIKKRPSWDKRYTEYCFKPPKERMRILLTDFKWFDEIWKALFDELADSIYEQKEYNRKSGGDIGVRVQSSGSKYSPTESKAICHMEIEDGILNCDLLTGLLVGVDNPNEISKKVYALHFMKEEVNVILQELALLSASDRKLFMNCVYYGKTIDEIAKDQYVEKSSISTRLWRIKKCLRRALIIDLSKEVERFEEGSFKWDM